jgi:hypothetical protein
MNYIEENLRKLRSCEGKTFSIGSKQNIYFLRPEDIHMRLMTIIFGHLENSDDEYGDDFEIENYKVIACNGVYENGRIVPEEISDIYSLNLETFRVIHVSNESHEATFESVDEFLKHISLQKEIVAQ